MKKIVGIVLITFAVVLSFLAPLFPPIFSLVASVAPSTHREDPTAPVNAPPEGSPRMVVQRFMGFAKIGNFDMAATLLDHRSSVRQGALLAEKLYVLIDQQGWIALQRVSDLPEGDITDSKDVNLELIGTIRLHGSDEAIVLRRSAGENGSEMTWKFDYGFLQKVPGLYAKITQHSLQRFFPTWSQEIDLWGLKLWQWFTLFSALFGTVLISFLLSSVSNFICVRLNRNYNGRFDDTIIRDSVRPLTYLLGIGIFHFFSLFLELPLAPRNVLYSGETFLALLIITLLGIKGSNLFIRYLQTLAEKSQHSNAIAMLPSARKALKIMIIMISSTYYLTQIGVNITAIVAGLGIGGIAIALAGQKTIENLIGGISLIADQPVRVGDYCRFSDNKEGKVEDIGLRSTRVRTLERTLIAIPNAEFSQIQIENFGKRDMIRYLQIISVRFDTSPEHMRTLLRRLKELLEEHEMVASDQVRVRFIKFGTNGLEIELHAYLHTNDNNIFLAVKEELNLRILTVIAECGSSLALPTSTISWERPARKGKSSSSAAKDPHEGA